MSETILNVTDYENLIYDVVITSINGIACVHSVSNFSMNRGLGNKGFDILSNVYADNVSFSADESNLKLFKGDYVIFTAYQVDYVGQYIEDGESVGVAFETPKMYIKDVDRGDYKSNYIAYDSKSYMDTTCPDYKALLPSGTTVSESDNVTISSILDKTLSLISSANGVDFSSYTNAKYGGTAFVRPYYIELGNYSSRDLLMYDCILSAKTEVNISNSKKIDEQWIMEDSFSSDDSYMSFDYISVKISGVTTVDDYYPAFGMWSKEKHNYSYKTVPYEIRVGVSNGATAYGLYDENESLIYGSAINGSCGISYVTALAISGIVQTNTYEWYLQQISTPGTVVMETVPKTKLKSTTFSQVSTSYVNTIANNLKICFNKTHGKTLRQCSLKIVPTFDIEIGDVVTVSNSVDGTSYDMLVCNIAYSYDGGLSMTISTGTLESGTTSTSGSGASIIICQDTAKTEDMQRQIDVLKNEMENIKNNKVDTQNLLETLAQIDNLQLGCKLFESIQSETITTDFLKAENEHVNWSDILLATIDDAMIKSLNANKILTGTLYTNNVLIQSEDGGIVISGNTQQFKDADGKVRMQMGRDANGNFNYSIFGADGKTAIFNENGIQQESAIPDGLIKDVKISNDANISAGKLDIKSLFSVINNDETYSLNSGKIFYDEKNASLDVVMEQMNSNIEELTNVAYGQVVTYNVDEIPTLDNYPAYDWIVPMYPRDTLYPSEDLLFTYSFDEYKKHLGSVCYLKDSTDSYRFCMADNGTFYWKLIEDSETAVLNSKVTALQVSVNEINANVTSMTTTIGAQGTSIEELSSRVTITENGLSSTVSKETYDNGMSGKVSKESVISSINQSAEEIKINASKLTLDGLVTATNLSNGTTTIDGSCIKTGSIESDNYVAETSGSKLNLQKGSWDSKNFKIAEDGAVSVKGNVSATVFQCEEKIDVNYQGMNVLSMFYQVGRQFAEMVLKPGSGTSLVFSDGGNQLPVRFDATEVDFSGSVYSSNWFRSNGNTGWYSETYGGGLYMNDTNWIRVFHDKGICTAGKMMASQVIPTADLANGNSIGNSNYRWNNIYSRSQTINTSDRNEKHDISYGVNEELFMKLKPCSYMFNVGDRTHFGFIAQDVEESMIELGMDYKDLGLLCRDVKTKEEKQEDGSTKDIEVVDENGNTEYRYGLRYSEIISMNTAMIQKLTKRIDELEKKLEGMDDK